MKKKNLRQEKGITLIALIITIIVMLILVAVTITIAVNGGLFNYARKASVDTNTAIKGEQKLADLEPGMITDDLIEKYTNPNVHSWTRSIDDVFTCSHCGASYTMGEQVKYTPDTTTASVPVSGTESGKTDEAVDQTISRPENLNTLTWIVLGLDKDGVLLITTSEPQGSLYLYGAKAYLNGPTIMNTACEKLYSSSTYGKARSINVDDVNIALRRTADDTKGMVFDTSGNTYKVNKGTKFGDTEETNANGKMTQADWDAINIEGRKQTPDGKALESYEIDGYYYMLSDIADGLPKTTVNVGNYWLASCGAIAFADIRYASFGPGMVYNGGVISYNDLFYSYGSEGCNSLGLRPVVSLRSTLPAKQANS